jgi:hypothetical protein
MTSVWQVAGFTLVHTSIALWVGMGSAGDSQALPGYASVYLQINDPRNSNKWDCFCSYRLSVVNVVDDSRSVHRDSWHRFSAKRKSHGWCDFAALSSVLDLRQGFLGPGDTLQVSTDITIVDEVSQFVRDNEAGSSGGGDVLSGRFIWRVRNFSAFQPLLRSQKIMSPAFPAGACGIWRKGRGQGRRKGGRTDQCSATAASGLPACDTCCQAHGVSPAPKPTSPLPPPGLPPFRRLRPAALRLPVLCGRL